MANVAVILAAGSGKRARSDPRELSKQFVIIGDAPMFIHSLRVFAKSTLFERILLVVRRQDLTTAQTLVEKYKIADDINALITYVIGGSERYDSVYHALLELNKLDIREGFMWIHDCARCCVKTEVLNAINNELKNGITAVSAAVPLTDTLKKSGADDFVESTIPRKKVWRIQTPQVFEIKLITEAYRRLYGNIDNNITDDCMMVEKIGAKVKLVFGDYGNIKVTHPVDFVIAETLLKCGRLSENSDRLIQYA